MGHPWHIRIHNITTDKSLYTADGGFAIGLESMKGIELEQKYSQTENAITITTEQGYSRIIDLTGNQKPEAVKAASNTNIMNPRTLIPTLIGRLKPGRTILASYISGDNSVYSEAVIPQVTIQENIIKVWDSNNVLYKLTI